MTRALRIAGLIALIEAIVLMTAAIVAGVLLAVGLAHLSSSLPDTGRTVACTAPDGTTVQVPPDQCIDGKYTP